MNYTKRYHVLWRDKQSRAYLMNAALKLARRMRARGHAVTVVIKPTPKLQWSNVP